MASRDFFKRLGPGIVTGAADDDPSGIGTYTSVGAAAGYGFLWSALWLLPLAFAVQEACARLALVTGKGLAAIIKARMPRWVLVVAVLLVAVANTVAGSCANANYTFVGPDTANPETSFFG